MSSLWPRIEPLLARVEKPARYIGMERGAAAPAHRPGDASWLLVYPDTYEVGLPNQGLQILYEILNERDDAAAERAYAPWVDLEAELRHHRVPLFSVETHRPAGDFDVIALSAEHPTPRSSSPAATARSTPSQWRTSSTPSSSATARRPSVR